MGEGLDICGGRTPLWGLGGILFQGLNKGGISPSSQRPGRTAPFLKVTRRCFAFWGLGSGRPFPFGAGARVLVGWRARILEEDARLWFPGCRVSFRRAGQARPDASHLPPGPGCDLQAAIRESDWRDHLPTLPAAPGVCSASPSDSPGSQASPSRPGQSAPLPLALCLRLSQ